jgi:aldehyde dehydrogenase (NAD+)/phenylacetaldehyde dehydrogenase
MRVAREEIFGPVLTVMAFDDVDEVVRRANDTAYGLAAGIWTRDLGHAHRIANQLEAGTVWVNTYNIFEPTAPFGGYKDSGFGRDLGEDAVLAYTQTKTVWINLD